MEPTQPRSGDVEDSAQDATTFQTHFDRMAGDYADARPPYPAGIYEALTQASVIGEGVRVLEIGAGTGLATRELLAAGCEVVALEPGQQLAALLRQAAPRACVIEATLEDSDLADSSFDSVVAATAMHWVDLERGLPIIHAALRPGGLLAVWRTIFGDASYPTPFRTKVADIVAARGASAPKRPDDNPSMEQLAAGRWFTPLRSLWWRWSIDLTSDQIRRLFATFSDWTDEEVTAAAQSADELGGRVTEHYQSVLHVLRRCDPTGNAIAPRSAS